MIVGRKVVKRGVIIRPTRSIEFSQLSDILVIRVCLSLTLFKLVRVSDHNVLLVALITSYNPVSDRIQDASYKNPRFLVTIPSTAFAPLTSS